MGRKRRGEERERGLVFIIKYQISYQNKPKKKEKKRGKGGGGEGGTGVKGGVWGKERRLIIEIVNGLCQI